MVLKPQGRGVFIHTLLLSIAVLPSTKARPVQTQTLC